MNQPLYQFFENDHRRLDKLLNQATKDPQNVKMASYQLFRERLLRHIKMEEKILFPAAKEANGGRPLAVMKQLRLEHGALTTLMVPPPTTTLINVLKKLLNIHDDVEEAPNGMYQVAEALTKNRTRELLDRVSAIEVVPMHPHNTADYALKAAIRSVERAGYDYKELGKSSE